MGTQIMSLKERAGEMRDFLSKPETQAQFAAALPAVGLTPQRFLRAALTAFTLNPDLYKCSKESVLRCLILGAQYGLAPTGKFGMYLIPFGQECTPIVDYRGLLQVARRSGEVVRVSANVVREGDDFEYEEGSKPFLRHRFGVDNEENKRTHVYAIAHLRNALELPTFVVLTTAQVEKYRARSKAKNSPMWTHDWDAAACKTALRRLCESGRMPMQDGDQRLVELLQSEDAGISLPPYERVGTDTLDVEAQSKPAGAAPAVGGAEEDDPLGG